MLYGYRKVLYFIILYTNVTAFPLFSQAILITPFIFKTCLLNMITPIIKLMVFRRIIKKMENYSNPFNDCGQRCPRCQSPLSTVVVHGHEQCVICKSNIFECCSGDTWQTDHNLSLGYKRS